MTAEEKFKGEIKISLEEINKFCDSRGRIILKFKKGYVILLSAKEGIFYYNKTEGKGDFGHFEDEFLLKEAYTIPIYKKWGKFIRFIK
ncbi:MAG: hypothetical protein WC346_09125 [Methanogenium sp.]|jgi:hypothetical protein